MGRITKDRFGQSGSAHSPLYTVPIQVKNTLHLLYRHEAEREAVADISPEACELKKGPTFVWTLVQVLMSIPCPNLAYMYSPSAFLNLRNIFYTTDNEPLRASDAYGLVNTSFGFRSASEAYSISVWGRNLAVRHTLDCRIASA